MAVGEQIRQTIHATKQTQKITRAMQMVAASKLVRTQAQMTKGRPYASHVLRVIRHMAYATTQDPHIYMQHREVKRVGFLVVSTDRGLCGGLNLQQFRMLVDRVKSLKEQGIESSFCLIGQKAVQFFNGHHFDVLAQSIQLSESPSVQDVIGVTKSMLDLFEQKKIDQVFLSFNDFVNTMSQKPVIQQVLPFPKAEEKPAQDFWDYIYEPGSTELMTILFRRYIESQIYQAVVENIASEQAARMVAMKSATDNAKDVIDDLQLDYNKVRQAVITQEIAEITAGANT